MGTFVYMPGVQSSSTLCSSNGRPVYHKNGTSLDLFFFYCQNDQTWCGACDMERASCISRICAVRLPAVR